MFEGVDVMELIVQGSDSSSVTRAFSFDSLNLDKVNWRRW